MTKDEKIDKLLKVYCDCIAISRGSAYVVAFGEWGNLPTEEMHKKAKDQAIITEAMIHLGLISASDSNGVNCQATIYGREIQEKGGWLNELILKSNIDKNEQAKNNLELENLKLQNDSLKNEILDRKNKEEIARLTIENLKLQNRNNRIWFFAIGGLLTYLISNWKEILGLLGLLKSE
jgi:hypothetical protein